MILIFFENNKHCFRPHSLSTITRGYLFPKENILETHSINLCQFAQAPKVSDPESYSGYSLAMNTHGPDGNEASCRRILALTETSRGGLEDSD